MPDIFISYKREERNVAEKIATALIQEGCSVWWDINLLPGERFAQEIETVIQHAKVAIVIWSKDSIQSDWVLEEASEAKRRDILVPVRVDSTAPPFGFRGLQTLDLSAWDRKSHSDDFKNLIELVSHRVKKSPLIDNHQVEKQSLNTFKLEAEFWRSIASASNQSASEYQSYIDRFGESAQFLDLAKGRIQTLREGKPSTFFDSWLTRVGSVIAVLSSIVALILSLTGINLVGTSNQQQEKTQTNPLAEVGDSNVVTGNSYEIKSATLSFSGDSEDSITEGENFNFIHNGNAFFTVNTLNENQISFNLETPDNWSFDLSVPVSDGFRTGASYKASRDAFSGNHFAGIDVSGNGRGCNEIDGIFEIESLQITQGVPVAARIKFTQHCDSEVANLRGMIVYTTISKTE